MKTVVVACETIKNELLQAMDNAGKDYQILWIESGLHIVPQNLHKRLQDLLNHLQGVDRVLLAMGVCGNAIVGLNAEHFQIIVPRVDDCITLLLGSMEKRKKISQEYSAYFLTQGWLNGERNILVEYQYMVEKYGEKTAKEIGVLMYKHYRTLMLLDTGTDSMAKLKEETALFAETFGWEQKTISGTLNYLERLLKGPWDESHFIIKNPGEMIQTAELYETF